MGNCPRCASLCPEEERCSDALEANIQELFRLHDLNGDGLLDARELVKLNEKVAKLHYGVKVDKEEIKSRYEQLFRNRLDASGRPVPFVVFRKYMTELLAELDNDRLAQEMIVEQFVAEARSARAAFHSPTLGTTSDAEFLSKMSLPDFFQSQGNLSSKSNPYQMKCKSPQQTSTAILPTSMTSLQTTALQTHQVVPNGLACSGVLTNGSLRTQQAMPTWQVPSGPMTSSSHVRYTGH
eukprot:TRINITY_DN97731_c0_g1_i1.p1 TRINITY_DN97731_c0_g1~~TRINITY_DN97731_c0_g1_i1.p1  ORF type:complete len:238 (-),score=37.63 TRINITY_DN97731_c0_g1_i1:79-792(-)